MFDKQVLKQLESMVNQMSPEQKKKLTQIMQDEKSLKNAIAGIDSKKAQQIVENLGKNIPKE